MLQSSFLGLSFLPLIGAGSGFFLLTLWGSKVGNSILGFLAKFWGVLTWCFVLTAAPGAKRVCLYLLSGSWLKPAEAESNVKSAEGSNRN